MFRKSAIVAGLALAFTASAQADYRFAVDGLAGRTNIDVGRDDGDVDAFGLGGTFYLNGVDDGKGPLAEAAFLDQASSVTAAWLYTDADEIANDLDSDTYALSGRYVLGLDALPLIFEGSYSRETPDFSDVDTYTLGFGAYLTDATELIVTYRNTDIDEGGDSDAYSARIKHIIDMGDGAIELHGEYGVIDVEDDDDIDAWNIGGIWYLNEALGFGVDYARFDNFGLEEDTYGANVSWFVTDSIGLSLSYAHSEIDDTDVESDSIVLGAQLRF